MIVESLRASVRDVARPLGVVVALLAVLAAATVAPRDALFTAVAGSAAGSSWGEAAAVVPEAGLLLLAAVAAVLAVGTLRRDRRRFVLVLPRAWPALAAVALAVAGGRVAAGVHYVHDTFTGLALGVVVTAGVGLLVVALAARVPAAARFVASSSDGPAGGTTAPHASAEGAPVTGGSADQGNVIHRSVSHHE